MRQIGTVLQNPASRESQPGPGAVSRTRKPSDPLPKISNPLTDVEIPRSAWSPSKEAGKPQQLRRQLTGEERTALQGRRDELAPALAPFGSNERPQIYLAIADMFGGFRSMWTTG